MREIEVKAKVLDMSALLTVLADKNVVLGHELVQNDVVYGQPNKKDNQLGAIWLRIRTENNKTVYFTLKTSVIGGLDSIEHETVVQDANELENIIKTMGYELYSDITKVRRKAHVGEIEICLDSVPGLGDFIEAEMLAQDDADHNQAVGQLWDVLNTFGISKDNEVHEGYDVLERKQYGL